MVDVHCILRSEAYFTKYQTIAITLQAAFRNAKAKAVVTGIAGRLIAHLGHMNTKGYGLAVGS